MRSRLLPVKQIVVRCSQSPHSIKILDKIYTKIQEIPHPAHRPQATAGRVRNDKVVYVLVEKGIRAIARIPFSTLYTNLLVIPNPCGWASAQENG